MIMVERPAGARLALIVLAVGVGGAVAIAPITAVLGIIALLGGLWLLSLGEGVQTLFLRAVAGILIGYAFFNRTFAYLGVPPLFVGEAVMGLGGLAFLYAVRRWQLTTVHVLILLFMAWGAAQTLPYIPRYGVDALRDAVAWLYAGYALLVATILRPEHLPSVVRLYRRAIPYFLVFLPIFGLVAVGLAGRLPTIPGTEVPLLSFKGGDAGVQLAGIAAFILIGLYARADPKPRLAEPLPWLPWLAGAGVVSIVNRGGMLAASTAALVLLFVRRSSRWTTVAFILALLIVVGLIVNPRVQLGSRREFSFQQLTDNVTSVFVSTEDSLQGTKGFRLAWWSYIVGYTVDGPYFWTGKGYGIALGEEDGFNTTEAEDLRSPHNGHIEILARSGVPGLALWILLQLAFALALLSAAARAKADGRSTWLMIIGWILVFWLAGLVNASFDPYLQGPQGGIWFWTIVGVGLVAIRAVRDGVPDPWEHAPEAAATSGRVE